MKIPIGSLILLCRTRKMDGKSYTQHENRPSFKLQRTDAAYGKSNVRSSVNRFPVICGYSRNHLSLLRPVTMTNSAFQW